MTVAAALPIESELDVDLPPHPYPGLRPFTKEEWPIFFGRESMCDDVIARLVRGRLVVVHGDSGCGKSSLIQAGVLPRLEQQAAQGGGRWRTWGATPGEEPLGNLARALARKPDGRIDDERAMNFRRVLNHGHDAPGPLRALLAADPTDHVCILIDQFEEAFGRAARTCPDEVALLVELMMGVQEGLAERTYVIVTMRSEFLGACARHEGFAEAVNAALYLVPRIEHADLVRAIREPATLYGGAVDRALAEHLIAEAGRSQDQLPLIQHALMRMNRTRSLAPGPPPATGLAGSEAPAGWRLSLDHNVGGEGSLPGLLSNHADRVADDVRARLPDDPASDRVLEQIFRALTEINADGHAIRRPQRLRELVAISGSDAETVRTIVDAFRADGVSFLRPYGGRPLSMDDRVDISHEALMRSWRRIADPKDGWLQREFRDGLAWRLLLEQAESFEQNHANILSSASVEERGRWLSGRTPAWAERYGGGWERVARLVESSAAEWARRAWVERQERARQVRARTRLTLIAWSAAIAFAVLAAFALQQRGVAVRSVIAIQQKVIAEKSQAEVRRQLGLNLQEQGRQFIVGGYRMQAFPLLVAARDLGVDGETLRMLLSETLPFPRLVVRLQAPVYSASFNADGTRVVTASVDKTARVWDAATGKPVTAPLEHQGLVYSASFSADGTRVVTASEDKTARVWDAATGKPVTAPLEHQGPVHSASFSADGTRVVTASDDKTARVWHFPVDARPLSAWKALLPCCPFQLSGSVLVPNTTEAAACPPL